MNRFVFVALLGLAGMGCAADVEDVVEPSSPPPERPTATKPFSGDRDPMVDRTQVVVDYGRLAVGSPPRETPPMPPQPGSDGE